MALSVAMQGWKGMFAYGNATFAEATEVCEVKNSNLRLVRDRIDATNRCSNGMKTYIGGTMDVEITGDLVLNKSASNTSKFDALLALFVDESDPGVITHVWFVDKFLDGIYFAQGVITELSETQELEQPVSASFSISPSTKMYRVLAGVITSTP